MATAETRRIHALVFDDPEKSLHAVKTLRGAGFDIEDVHSPFPVHGMDEAMGMRETRLPYATLVGGMTGLTLALSFQLWTHTQDWPLNVGGKTFAALPATLPVAFELTVLFGGLATFVALVLRAKLRPRLSGEPPVSQPLPGVTDDKFVVLVAESDARFSPRRFGMLCDELAPEGVIENWRVL